MTTTSTTTAGQSTGGQAATALNNDIKGAKSAIERGDWLDAGLQITNVAMDVINIAGDPLGACASAGFGWIINHIKFLKEPFDKLLGDANSIINSAQGWVRAGDQLIGSAQKYREAVRSQTCNWQGSAGDAYRRAAATQAEGLDALAEVSKGVGKAIDGAGKLLAEVRKAVLDFINQCVQKVIQIIIEALAKAWLSFGASIAEGIARSVAQAVQTAQKILSKVQKFVSSLQKIMQTVQKIVALAKAVKQLLATIGGKANTSPSATTTQAPTVNTNTLTSAAGSNYTNPNGVTNNANYGQGAVPGYGGYQPLPGSTTNAANYGQGAVPGYGGYQQPSGTPTGQPTYGQSAGNPNYGGYQQLPGGVQRQPGTYTPSTLPGHTSEVKLPTGSTGTPNWGPSGPPPTAGAPASLVDRARWIGAAVEVLINHGVDPAKINPEQIAQIVDRTSGGNPHAVNLQDPNAANGFPPKGICQLPDPVFDQHKIPGYDDIWKPVDNMLAGVRYFLAEWGSLLDALQGAFGQQGPAVITQH
ncbi:hypothetical protein [Actinokineospora globicatena]|uniref:hypothetical protein n=1 Tax=Actinokineospora globicatena TaxID=103729 RepID=UPI0020A5CFAA|nr:hypothetical protein [Actinokineospora globicatena]MCP2300732.1 Transglycosylase SLT domain [Actinokineospora globicatena]GLW77643.1 hypothetical protein Aglo01_21250 [Actinokineospora globicatena]GLW84479.1 hypothetical protein Aglo02_21190 [Actinokineospora globicatena]